MRQTPGDLRDGYVKTQGMKSAKSRDGDMQGHASA